ncbi:MAG: L-dopachrome tautomerase-related protein [Pseudomonadota bacterium]
MSKNARSWLHAMALGLTVSAGPAVATGFEIVATFGAAHPPGNLAIGPDGRMFMSVHEFYGQPLRVVEVLADGAVQPYPDAAWSAAPSGDGPGLNGVLGLRADRNGVLWMLDGQSEARAGRVVAWDTRSESLHSVHYLAAPVTRASSFLNDLAVDLEHNAVYISDTGDGRNSALIVLDLDTGRARRVLEGSHYTVPEDIDMVIDGRTIELGGQPARIGVNPITVDPTNTWVYFAPMSGTSMYRVRTADLNDAALGPSQLLERVERYGDKPISDGSTVDADGNVYITAMADDAIGVVRPSGEYSVLYQSADALPWPDGFAMGVDGHVYATVNELHRSPVLNGGTLATTGQFKIVRFPALGGAVSGR